MLPSNEVNHVCPFTSAPGDLYMYSQKSHTFTHRLTTNVFYVQEVIKKMLSPDNNVTILLLQLLVRFTPWLPTMLMRCRHCHGEISICSTFAHLYWWKF